MSPRRIHTTQMSLPKSTCSYMYGLGTLQRKSATCANVFGSQGTSSCAIPRLQSSPEDHGHCILYMLNIHCRGAFGGNREILLNKASIFLLVLTSAINHHINTASRPRGDPGHWVPCLDGSCESRSDSWLRTSTSRL